MKKRIILIAACAMCLSTVGCGQRIQATESSAVAAAETTAGTEAAGVAKAEVEAKQTGFVAAASQAGEAATESKVLVAYFSRAENIGGAPSVDAVSSASINIRDGEVIGNMQAMAEVIKDLTGGDLFSIQTEKTYSQNYRQSTNEAREELNSNARPALVTHVENMDQYEVIYIGFPNWWGTIPTAVSSFLEEYDLEGKTIIPFCSHEGSGFGNGVSAISELCPKSTILDGYAVRGSRATAAGTKDEIAAWLQEIGQQ